MRSSEGGRGGGGGKGGEGKELDEVEKGCLNFTKCTLITCTDLCWLYVEIWTSRTVIPEINAIFY